MIETRLLLGAGMLVFASIHLVWSHREHKVHNIVLYPDKHSWCKTTPIKQVVAYPGCSSVEVDNNVCVGACFSYSIPRTSPSAPGEVIKPYCDSCQPSSVVWQHVTLVCEGEEDMEERVQMIENCSCSTCDMGEEGGGGTSLHTTSSGEKASHLAVPELMDLMLETHNTRRNNNETGNMSDPLLNDRLVLLLKQFDEDEESVEDIVDLDQVALKELLQQVEGVDHRVNQVALIELVRRVEETEHIQVNIAKLRHVMIRFAREEMEKEQLVHMPPHVKAHRHHLHSHHHLNHHGISPEVIHKTLSESSSLEVEKHHPDPITASKPTDNGPAILGGVFVNSEVGEQEKRDPTLDVASHHLKPALHGTELSYHENVVLPKDEKHVKTDPEEF